MEKITDSINRFIFTTLEPLLKPYAFFFFRVTLTRGLTRDSRRIMSQATTALALGSAEVINNDDQFEVVSGFTFLLSQTTLTRRAD